MKYSFLSVGLIALFVTGCGSSDGPKLGSVTGSVTLNGLPLSNATVEFIPSGGGRNSIATTDASGAYSLMYTSDAEGAIVGPHTVRITSAVEGVSDEGGDEGGIEARAESVPRKYNDDSTLQVEVKSGSNTHDFDLMGERGPERKQVVDDV